MNRKSIIISTNVVLFLYVLLLFNNRHCYDGRGDSAITNWFYILQLFTPLCLLAILLLRNVSSIARKNEIAFSENFFVKNILLNLLVLILVVFILNTIFHDHYESDMVAVLSNRKMLFTDKYYGMTIEPCSDFRIEYYVLFIGSIVSFIILLLKMTFLWLTRTSRK